MGWVALHVTPQIPTQTVFLISSHPFTLQKQVRTEDMLLFPRVWQRAMMTDARSIVVFGVARQEDHFVPFVIKPRWLIDPVDQVRASRMAMALVSDEPLELGRAFSHFETYAWKQVWIGSQADAWMNFALLRVGTAYDALPSIITASLKNKRWITSLSYEQTPTVGVFFDADFSITTQSSSSSTQDLMRHLLYASRIVDGRSDELTSLPFAVAMWLSTNRMPEAWRLDFRHDLPVQDMRILLARMGVFDRKIRSLTDESIFTEKRLIAVTSTDSAAGVYATRRFQEIRVASRTIEAIVTSSTHMWEIRRTVCRDAVPLARLSSHAIQTILEVSTSTNTVPTGVSIGSVDKKLVFCFE